MAPCYSAPWGRLARRRPAGILSAWEGTPRCRLMTAEQSLLGGVRVEAVHELARPAQRGGVPTVDLIGGDAQALSGDAAKETKGEQTVVATDQDPRGDAGPSPQRRRFPHPGLRLAARSVQRLGGQLRRDILVEQGDRIVVSVPY